jgi:hypothetical protein
MPNATVLFEGLLLLPPLFNRVMAPTICMMSLYIQVVFTYYGQGALHVLLAMHYYQG